ncbi:hypothetical protein BIV25_28275 [Streptomyces sp. MUSC 14]|uniref:hypothetical protein n=1 Tax=Streptomyces sp. MUSC 14 TaxID=1354889 RepID=UPI0008F5B28D|nr:hypothetical protein [Streptomyces sp. MUSC 14]OIJ92200.1 hypothetical protein BIV25_28275 [Streptomyces sp. MUSC 14]
MSPRFRTSRRALSAAAAAALTLALAACGSGSSSDKGHDSGMAGTNHSAMPSPSGSGDGMASMPGMDSTSTGNGLAAAKDGYKMTATAATLPAKATDYRFTVTGPDGKPVTDFAVDQTKRLHFYAIRSDLTGFQHVHPTMAGDGTWTAPLAALQPGTWRLYASFTPDSGAGKGKDFVLSRTAQVSGMAMASPLPKPSGTATVDGYTVAVKGDPMAGMAHQLTVTVAKDGKPVTDLQPYLDTYAHLTAFHQGDLAFAHLHPETKVDGDHGGPTLTFHAEFAQSGNWRLFLQFQTGGKLHTAPLTLHVG